MLISILIINCHIKKVYKYFVLKQNGKYGVINVKDEVIIPFEYDRSGSKMEIGIGEIFTSNKNN